MKIDNLHQLIREAETDYTSGSVTISEHVSFDMYETLNTIDAYLNSKHISGDTDSLGREKPFFDIVTAASNIWYRATDLDRKNIRFVPTSKDTVGSAFIASILLQDWMRKSKFGIFLNDWGRTLARYGSAVVKVVEKGGELEVKVIPWNRLIVDPIDFDSLPTIEVLYKTPAQLRANSNYDQEVVSAIITAQEARETIGGNDKDNKNNFIKLYEVHGELPEYLLTDKEPDEEKDIKYRQQMHVVTFVKNNKGEYEDFTLYRGRESKHPYKLHHLIEEDGRTLAKGAVEHLFEAQWMVNHSQKNIKDTLDLASKLIFQTADTRYAGRNVLSAIETGDIMIHDKNTPLTRIANDKADITAFQNFKNDWEKIASEITSTPDALKGQTLPSGTPYSLGAYLGGQASSLFEIMTENKGLQLEELIREFVIPHVRKKMDTKDEVVAILEADQIEEIDAMYVPNEAKRRYIENDLKKSLLNLEVPPEFDQVQAESSVKNELSTLSNKRSFKPDELGDKTWNEALNNLEFDLIVEITGEQSDKQAVLTTLSSLFQTIASNPTVLQDPNAKLLFNTVLTETGRISPIQLTSTSVSPPQTTGGNSGALQDITKTQ